MLTAGKGWVLAVLAMLAAQWAAARGCARLRSRPTAALALRCAPVPPGGVGDEGRPDPSTRGLRPGSNKGLDKRCEALDPASQTQTPARSR